ncbi:Slp family lipoprotein [Izhakiella capsodis]|uniref:Slp family lipoprotein n=1 Tax=Izhakiella capsodis TaxID=1367852 RepID=UPI0015A50BE2|nr:Slp family lipoprotein [Izhakiella capsodis]
MKKLLLPVLISGFIVTGCSSIPKNLGGNSELVSTASYQQLYENPVQYKGQEVRIGGRVVNVINHENETLFEIAVQPLDKTARPDIDQPYQGRVMVKKAGFIDPLTLRNHLITVLGTVDNSVQGRVGKAQYKFIVLNMLGYQIWHIRENLIPVESWNYGFGPYWNDGWSAYPYPYPYVMDWGWYPAPDSFQIQKTIVK